jgi:hypothetical protein
MEATKWTLATTTQLVGATKAETRMMPRMHVECHLPSL